MGRPVLTGELSKHVLPPVEFDGLALAAANPRATAAFWGAVLRGPVDDLGGGRYRVRPGAGRPARETIRVHRARALSFERSRVHVDVRLPGAAPEELLAAGARIVRAPGADPWYVLADPEHNRFCAYPAVDDRPAGIFQLVVKSRDPHAQARWWGDVLGGEVTVEGEAAAVRAAPEFPWDFLLFDPVPEPRTPPNRLHWHVTLRDPEPSGLIVRGARLVRAPGGPGQAWVLADPEGNEFCAVGTLP
jgi:hypothetical protein